MSKELRESEARYRAIVENQTELICRFGRDMALTFVNQAVCQLLDQPREALLGRRMEEFVHPNDRETLQRQIATLTLTSPDSFVENRYVLPNGETRWGQWSNRAVFDQKGNIQEIQSVGRDVTAQHEMERKLRKNEAMLSQAEEIAGVGSFIWNPNDESLQWSRNLYAIFGLKEEEFTGDLEETIFKSVHPEDRNRVRSEVESMLAMKETWPFEYRIIRPDGQVRLLRSGAKWLFDSGGEEPACLGILLDVTEQKETDKAREASQRFLQLTLDALSSNIAILDETGTILYVNSAWREFARCNQAPVDRVVEGANYLQVCDEATGEDAAQARECAARIGAVVRGELQSFSIEYPCHSPDERRWFVASVTRFSTEGQCRVVVAHENITERKLAEEALAEAKLHLELALQAADIGTWDWNLTTGNVFFSREWKRQLGYEEHEIASHYREWEQRLHPHDLQPTVKTLNEYLQGRAAEYCTEFRLRHKDGGYRWIFTRGQAVRDKTGKPLRLSGCNVDISERKAREKQLAEAKEAAEAASRAKSTFLANMSHEIRTPMAAITGFTELLLTEQRAPDEQREYLSTIQRNAQSLLTIINDILDLSKIEAEKLEVEPMDCSPRQLVEDVKKSLQKHADEKGLGFDVTYVEPLPLSIHTDPQKLRQI
ncbi:MAG: PAS domain-containing sensor histidine kinase, partial [bacterium]